MLVCREGLYKLFPSGTGKVIIMDYWASGIDIYKLSGGTLLNAGRCREYLIKYSVGAGGT
jgi:hypothetical protein